MTTTVQPESLTIDVRGLRLHYLDWGNADAPPLLLLHGLSGTAPHWQRVAERFTPANHVIALDQRGHGESQWAPAADGYGTDDFVADLEAFVDVLGLERFVLVGHSMGGHNTIAYTSRHPERIVCAVANDIPPSMKRDPAGQAQRFADGQHPVFPDIEAWMDEQRKNSEFTPDEMLRLSATRLKEVEGGVQLRSDPNASIYWAPKDLWDEARTIARPILFVRGGRSGVLDAETLQRMDMEIEPARSITLEKSGHNTFFDMEPEFLAIVSDFIAAHRNQ